MAILKTSNFKNVSFGSTRTCPECEEPGLEITEDLNIFECNFCGSIWQRLKPVRTIDGKMTKIPAKLKELLK